MLICLLLRGQQRPNFPMILENVGSAGILSAKVKGTNHKMIMKQDSKKLGKFIGKWNGETETDSCID